jgi:hypothetical protein
LSDWKIDPGAVLFNLTRCRSFPCVDHKGAINCSGYWGPYFGSGELAVYYEPFNKSNACYSIPNKKYFKIPVNIEGINILTNKKSVKSGYGEE